MDDELKARLNESLPDLLTWLETSAETAADFIAREAPLVVGEMVAWAKISNSIGATIFLLVGIAVAIAAVVIWKRVADWENSYDRGFARMLSASLGALCSVASLGFALELLAVAVKATVAPRLYVLEQLKGLL